MAPFRRADDTVIEAIRAEIAKGVRSIKPSSAEGRAIAEQLELEMTRKRSSRARPVRRPRKVKKKKRREMDAAARMAVAKRTQSVREERMKEKYYVSEPQLKMHAAARALEQDLGHAPTAHEVGQRIGLKAAVVAACAKLSPAFVYEDGLVFALEGELELEKSSAKRSRLNKRTLGAKAAKARSKRGLATARRHMKSGDHLAAAAHLLWHVFSGGAA